MFSGSLICVAYTLSQDSETAQLRSACLSARVLTLCMHKLSYINYFFVNCSVEICIYICSTMCVKVIITTMHAEHPIPQSHVLCFYDRDLACILMRISILFASLLHT